MEQNDKYLGKRLEGRYEIQELIGMGGMANVYKAFDIIDQQTVAVKILRDEYLSNTEFLRRFKNESKAIAVLSHPNIVRVFDVSFTNRVHSIVMEYIDGITLKEFIERQGVLSWKEAVHFTLQILRALQHAHEKGIVHRDIKPQNIMLLQNGTIKVTDFGIARFARSEVKTITDRAIGSVHYISPEQAMGDNTDEKSDIYSVGVMLFEMLTGRLPFEADTPVSVALKQIQTQAVRPTEINPDIPSGLESITIKAMQKDASNRYSGAFAMMEDIERFKQDPSTQFQYKYMNSADSGKKVQKAIKQAKEPPSLRNRPQPRAKRTPYLPILTGVTFAFVLASIAFVGLMVYMNNPFTKVPELEVENFVGLKFDTAKESYAMFEFVQESVAKNNDYPKGVIFEQDPRPGRTVREGATIKVKVSDGQAVVILENFTGHDAPQVKRKLEDVGLNWEEKFEYSKEVSLGCVIYTNPGKGSEVNGGALVTIYTSLGPDEAFATIPDVTGFTLEAAKMMLEMSNVRVGNVSYTDAPEPPGTIVAQDPDGGSLQLEGTAVNLLLSQGGDGAFKRSAITVPLPSVDREVMVEAYVNGSTQPSLGEILNPSQTAQWKPAFEGESGIIQIEIRIDGEPYREYEMNFNVNPVQFMEVTGGVPGFDRNAGSSSGDEFDPYAGYDGDGFFSGMVEPRDDH